MYEDRLRKKDWEVRTIDLSVARDLVEKHHYAKGGSNTATYRHGLFRADSGECFGVAWWLPPTRVAAESVNRMGWRRVVALSRLVIHPDVPANACSFLLGKSIKLIRQEGRFDSLVTYADEAMGHTGQIYRATNWEYKGRTGPYPRWVDPKTGRQVAKKATKNRRKAEMESLGYVQDGPFYKHKFVMHLTEEALNVA